MIGEYTIVEWIQYLLKKWWKILLIALCFALLLGIPKTLTGNMSEEKIKVHMSGMITFENHDKYRDGDNVEYHLNYSDIWLRDPIFEDFRATIDAKYDMARFDKNWNKIDGLHQMSWFRDRIVINPMGNTPAYEISFYVWAEQQNLEYVCANIEALYDDLIKHVENSTKIYHPKSTLTVLNKSFQEGQNTSEFKFSMKYYIIGAFLGALLAIFIWSLLFLSDKKVTSKNLLKTRFLTDSLESHADKLSYSMLCYAVRQVRNSGKKLIVISSTLEDHTFFSDLINEFSCLGYTILSADFTGTIPLQTNGNVSVMDSTSEAAFRRPGHCSEQVDLVSANYDYIVIFSALVTDDCATLELFENSACGMFVEQVGESNKYPLESSLAAIRKEAKNLPLCLVWKK